MPNSKSELFHNLGCLDQCMIPGIHTILLYRIKYLKTASDVQVFLLASFQHFKFHAKFYLSATALFPQKSSIK